MTLTEFAEIAQILIDGVPGKVTRRKQIPKPVKEAVQGLEDALQMGKITFVEFAEAAQALANGISNEDVEMLEAELRRRQKG